MYLTNPEHKPFTTKQGWQALRQQTHAHVPSFKTLDLNRICVDTIRMELLIFPVVEHWKRPLTNAEWNHINKETVQLEKQMEKMRKLSILVRKRYPHAFPDIAPLFHKLFEHNQELRSNWNYFKKDWSNYKKDWEQFQSKKKESLNNRQKPSKKIFGQSAASSSTDESITPPVSPPMFSRDRWHALRVSSKALEVEVLHQCQRFRNESEHDSEEDQNETHPGVRFLVEELRKIYLKTHGFELIERVKLVQERNDQLMQELQPFFPEPIISAEMQAETKPASSQRITVTAKSKKEQSSVSKLFRKILLFALLIFLAAFSFFLAQKYGSPPGKTKVTHLKFVPKEKTVSAKSSSSNKLTEFNLDDMLSSFNSNIPVLQSNERLKKLLTAPPEIIDNIANTILQEIGKNAVFVFSEAQSLILFWKGKLEKFASPQDLQKKLVQLDRQYKNVEALWKKMGNNAPDNLKIVPDLLDGKPTYALEMLDANGDPMQVYMTEEGVLLRLSNGKLLDKTLTADQVSNKMAEL